MQIIIDFLFNIKEFLKKSRKLLILKILPGDFNTAKVINASE